ncbi:hypothetical protein DSO57_1036596 [Entomophthora muscae]|nr:hypothetical protein DSO57_1036596 [Entomophthora muscae]
MSTTNLIRPKKKPKRILSEQVTNKVGAWLTPDQRLKFLELDMRWYSGLIKYFFETLDDYWFRKETPDLTRMLKKYGEEVRKITLSQKIGLLDLEFIFQFCPNVTHILVEEVLTNELFDLVHDRYAKQLVDVQISAAFDANLPELAQIPHFPHMHTLRCQRMTINSTLLSELLYFVPENLRVLNLSKLSAIESSTIRFITTNFPNLEFLDLVGEFFMESAILSLDFYSEKLSMLTFGEVGSLTRACHKFQLKPSNLPNLTELRVRGWEGLAEDGNRMPQLLAGAQYPYRHLVLYALNMNVDYTFTAQRFSRLTYLSLDSCTLVSADAITQIFIGLPTLVKLCLDNAAISDEHFLQISRRLKNGLLAPCPIRYLSVKDLNSLGDVFLGVLVNYLDSLQYLDVTDTLPNGTIPSSFLDTLINSQRTLSLMTLRAKAPLFCYDSIQWIISNSPRLVLLEIDDEFQNAELLQLRDKVRPKLDIRSEIDDYDVFFSSVS